MPAACIARNTHPFIRLLALLPTCCPDTKSASTQTARTTDADEVNVRLAFSLRPGLLYPSRSVSFIQKRTFKRLTCSLRSNFLAAARLSPAYGDSDTRALTFPLSPLNFYRYQLRLVRTT